MAIVVFLIGGWHQGLHVWTPECSGQQLREAHVRDAESADAAVAPRLSAYPLLRVVAILDFAHIWVPRAVRVIPPAAILEHYGVAVLHEIQGPGHVSQILI